MTDETRCSAQVPGYGGWNYHRCSKPGKVEEGGKWYCGVHNPAKGRAAAAARTRKWAIEDAERDRREAIRVLGEATLLWLLRGLDGDREQTREERAALAAHHALQTLKAEEAAG